MSVELSDLENINKKFSNTKANPDNWDRMYCAGLMFNTRMNSGSRLIMSSAFESQAIIPNHPDFPKIYTGYENAFGRYADSIVKSDKNYKVVGIISKFPNLPRHIYFYIVQDILTGVYDIIEIKHYESYAEAHGHVKPQTDGDLFPIGSVIPEGKILASAPTRDKNGNYCTGFNAKVAYVSLTDDEEDGYGMREGFAKETTYMQIEELNNTINKNIITCNIYGNEEEYKSFPDVGEDIENGIICVNRQVNYGFAASETTKASLAKILESDVTLHGKGKIIDIDVFINDEEELKNNACRNQIMKYWLISKIYHQKIIDELGKIVNNKNNKWTYRLQMLYERSKDFMNPDIQFSSNNGVFEFGFIKFTTAYEASLIEGSKITDRAASKGVICHIIPDEMMPRDKWGNVADIIQSPPSIVGRANSEQTYESEKNFISFFVRRKMAEATKLGVQKQFAILYDYLEYIDKVQADELKVIFDNCSEYDQIEYIADVIANGIYIRQGPTNNMSYEQICYLYDKYKIKPDRVRIQRTIKKHGYNSALMIDKDDDDLMFTILKNKKGEIINELITPQKLEEDKAKNKEKYGDNDYAYTTTFALPNGNKPEDGIHFVDMSDEEKPKFLGEIRRKSIDELIDESWSDKTYIVKEDKDTITLSFLTQGPVIIAEKFFLILEHVPDGKASARYIGTTNPLGLPNKSGKSENEDTGAYGTSPIKYGEMEVNNALIRVDPKIVFRYLSEVAVNPELRNILCRILLYDDPLTLHNIDVPITDKCDNIPAKELNAYLFCLGIEIMNDESEDIYSEFDDRFYSDDELDKIFALHVQKNPPTSLTA